MMRPPVSLPDADVVQPEDAHADVVQPGDAHARLMQGIGHRVRAQRGRHGISREQLAQRSGVSIRSLAQLEGGGGNISLGLLQRVAQALGLGVEALVAESGPARVPGLPDAALAQLVEGFRRANAATRAQVLDLLGEEAPALAGRAQRVCLVGMRGAGKSTLGRLAGLQLDVPFIELNREISQAAGLGVPEIFDLYGAQAYRRLEAEALERVAAAHERVILATGGGIVSGETGFVLLRRSFHTIWIQASPREHMDRVLAQGDRRPMGGDPQAMARLVALLRRREAGYRLACAHLDTTGQAPEQSLEQLLALIRTRRFL